MKTKSKIEKEVRAEVMKRLGISLKKANSISSVHTAIAINEHTHPLIEIVIELICIIRLMAQDGNVEDRVLLKISLAKDNLLDVGDFILGKENKTVDRGFICSSLFSMLEEEVKFHMNEKDKEERIIHGRN